MKNPHYESLGRRMLEYHRSHPWRLSEGGLYIPHDYSNMTPESLSYWDDVGLLRHNLMLGLSLRTRDWSEAAGQVLRLALVPLGHLSGRLPLGNPGRATVSAFEPLPVRPELAILIARAREH